VTAANEGQPMTAYLRLAVITALSCSFFETFTT